ncbi:Uncharacterised protein [Chlamydia abortus]|uniref:hypothetical protein n=1 Tax=Paenibacillus sp. SAFN-117 TaxID=3436860 RepID=UPI000A27E20B|nr:Uncharacterised protein [Chlamydia abortus]SHE13941.1 Uncharacterised protein [Chlamydia abortus]
MMTDIGRRRKIRSIIKQYPEVTDSEITFLIQVIKEKKVHLIVNRNNPIFMKDQTKYRAMMDQLGRIENRLLSGEAGEGDAIAEVKEFFLK